MQIAKGKIRKARDNEERLIIEFCHKIGIKNPQNTCYKTLYVLVIPHAKFKDVFDPSNRILRFLEENLDWNAYSIGTYLGLIGKNGFEPSLLLSHKLANKCLNPVHCAIIDEEGEKYFLYGKIVLEEHIVEYNNQGYVLVVNKKNESLGWGILEKERNDNTNYVDRLVLRPVKDLGWYLRRGG
jgi:60S ribosome subunit biogenesis protein NIP7